MLNILQNDGNDSLISDGDSSETIDYDTDEEFDPIILPAILTPVPNQIPVQGQPIQLEVRPNVEKQPPLPLRMMLNAWSLYNKSENFKNLLHQIGPEITIVSETWERQKQSLENLLSSEQFKVLSYKRSQTGNKQPGGAVLLSTRIRDTKFRN